MQPIDYSRLVVRLSGLHALLQKTENEKTKTALLKKERRTLRQLRRVARLLPGGRIGRG